MRVTVPVAALAPACSLKVVGVMVSVSVGTSLSVIVTFCVALFRPEAAALIKTSVGPVAMPSSTAVRENEAEVAPLGMVIEAGTCALPGLLLLRVTVSGPVVAVLRVTTPVAALTPAVSLKVAGLMVSVRVGPSLSVTVTV